MAIPPASSSNPAGSQSVIGDPTGKTILGHPPGLFLLFCVEMWERFSFYGMRTILGLYLKCRVTGMDPLPSGAPPGFNPGRGWSNAEAANLTGWYGGMAYLLPIAGGLIADKMIGTHRSMLVGGTQIAIGHILLGISGLGTLSTSNEGMSLFIAGLALIVIGTGHFKPSVSVMVNQLYPEQDSRRQSAFGIFYMGINLGALLGTFFCSWLGERWGWHWGFTLAAIGMIAGLITYRGFRSRYLQGVGDPPDGKGKSAPVFLVVGLILAGLFGLASHNGWLSNLDKVLSSDYVGFSLLGAGLLGAAIFTGIQTKGDRGPVASIFIYMAFNFLFWLAFEQAATSINYFTDERLDRKLGEFLVPTGWFQNINPFVIIALSPVFGIMWMAFTRRKIAVTQPVKIGLGLIWLGLGFLFMVFAGHQAKMDGAMANMWLVVATYFLHTVGELFLSPTGLSYVTAAAPVRFKSLLMGIWFLSSFLAYTIGGKLAGHADPKTLGSHQFFFQQWGLDMGSGYANFFFLFVFLAIAGGVLIIGLSPLLVRLQRSKYD